MKRLAVLAALLLSTGLAFANTGRETCAMQFKAHNKDLLLPSSYSRWVPVRADFKSDLNVSTKSQMDQVFIEPGAFNSYVESGEWPQQSMIVLEVRENQVSAHRAPSEKVIALEVAVKDGPDTWSYYGMSPGHTRRSALSKSESDRLLVQSLPKLQAIIEGQIPVESSYF